MNRPEGLLISVMPTSACGDRGSIPDRSAMQLKSEEGLGHQDRDADRARACRVADSRPIDHAEVAAACTEDVEAGTRGPCPAAAGKVSREGRLG
jgi:hypothetical protein